MRNLKGDLARRFPSLIDKDGPVPDHRPDLGPCWVFLGTPTSGGYASVADGDRTVRLHRWSYEHHVAPIPEGLELDHLCRRRICVRPSHLEPVTHAENVARALAATGAAIAVRDACRHGHPYTPQSFYRSASGKPVCRPCRNAAVAAHRSRKRATDG